MDQTATGAQKREILGGRNYIAKNPTPRPFKKLQTGWWKKGKEREAQAIESRRRQPYRVICECYGQTITFGFSEHAGGGVALNMAKLVPWAKNPRVEGKRGA